MRIGELVSRNWRNVTPVTHTGTGEASGVRVLVAAIPPAARELRDALTPDFRVDVATALQDALRVMEAKSPGALIVDYHFDELRPYRLIHTVAGDYPDTRILLVRMMHFATAHEEDEAIGDAYRAMGVSQYLVLDTDDRSLVRSQLFTAIGSLLTGLGPDGASYLPVAPGSRK